MAEGTGSGGISRLQVGEKEAGVVCNGGGLGDGQRVRRLESYGSSFVNRTACGWRGIDTLAL